MQNLQGIHNTNEQALNTKRLLELDTALNMV